MRKSITFLAFLVAWNLGAAQDLLITNARIIDGTGQTIQRGSVVVRDGRIVSVSEGTSANQGAVQIDAQGMTVMPGMIDTHIHLLVDPMLDSDEALELWIEEQLPDVLREYLASGFTAILSNGDYIPAILQVRQRLNDGELHGPRLFVSGPAFTAPGGHPTTTLCKDNRWCRLHLTAEVADVESARTRVRELADGGVDAIKAIYDGREGSDASVPMLDDTVLSAIAEEARALDLPTIVHAVTVDDMFKAVNLGASKLVHTPRRGSVAESQGGGYVLRAASVPVSTTVGVANTDAEVGALANVRQLWDAGVTVAFGTDQTSARPAAEALAHEVGALSIVLSPAEIITTLTRNGAAFLDLSDELGTLEPGKLADIVIINGDPLADISDLSNVEIVIQGGRIVVDNR